MIKEWYTVRELAEFLLPGLPSTRRGILKRSCNEKWSGRARENQGGGFEYHITNLPQIAQDELINRAINATSLKNSVPIEQPQKKEDQRKTARLIILRILDIHRASTKTTDNQAVKSFCVLYKLRGIEGIPEWIYELFPNVSERSIWRWKEAKRNEKYNILAKSQNNRSGTGILDRAEGGKVKDFIVAVINKQPHLSAAHVRDLTRSSFGEILNIGQQKKANIPDIRTFRRFISNWKKENEYLHQKLKNPDVHKSRYQVAIGRADDGVERLNQVWEIDASPVDALCVDGRYNLYAIIDIWSRRSMFLISKTPRTEASLLLVRKAILAWGVPEAIKTDNGSDFTSYQFCNALLHMGIEQKLCTAYTPESKPFVERVIKTLQHSLMPLLPGYVGHSVSDKKDIEARKKFSERLGQGSDKAFCIELNHEELQVMIDKWAEDKYAHNIHSGINTTPFARAASWTGGIKRIENERALDLLLAPIAGQDGYRTIGKKGLRIDGGEYFSAALATMMGRRVFVRHDPNDMGRVFCFDEHSGEFICEAIDYRVLGVDPMHAAAAAKAAQKAHEREIIDPIRKEGRKLTSRKMAEDWLSLAAEDRKNITAFPQKSEAYSTPSLYEAEKSFSSTRIESNATQEEISKLDELRASLNHSKSQKHVSDEDRWWNKYKSLEEQKLAGEPLNHEQEEWMSYIETQAFFKARRDHELRGGVL